MQPPPPITLQAELHGSSSAKERRHQDDNFFTTSCSSVTSALPDHPSAAVKPASLLAPCRTTEVVPFPVRDLLYAATGEMLYFNVIPRPVVHRREAAQA